MTITAAELAKAQSELEEIRKYGIDSEMLNWSSLDEEGRQMFYEYSELRSEAKRNNFRADSIRRRFNWRYGIADTPKDTA